MRVTTDPTADHTLIPGYHARIRQIQWRTLPGPDYSSKVAEGIQGAQLARDLNDAGGWLVRAEIAAGLRPLSDHSTRTDPTTWSRVPSDVAAATAAYAEATAWNQAVRAEYAGIKGGPENYDEWKEAVRIVREAGEAVAVAQRRMLAARECAELAR